MQSRKFSRFIPTPSMAVSLFAVVIALGSAGYAATGGTFILGATNSAAAPTRLVSSINGPALVVANANTGASASAFAINVGVPGKPPFTVNTTGKVVNLNADYLDNLDSTAFPRVMRFTYNLAAGAYGDPITLPLNTPALVIGNVTTEGVRGTGMVSITRVGPNAPFLIWTGLESTVNSSITDGFSAQTGDHILNLSYNHNVDIEVNDNSSIRVHNERGDPVQGAVTVIY